MTGVQTCALPISCEEGYTDNGLECEEITAVACEGITCSEHGTCEVDLSGIPFCVCDDDYIAVNLECLQNDPGGDTVFMVQNPDETDFIPNGDFVILQLVTVIAKDTYGSRQGNFWVTEPAGGPWSSVQVYNADTTSTWWNQMQVGSVVNVHGLKMEYSYLDPYTNEPLFEDPLTEITEASVTVLGSGTPVGPVSINATDLLTIEAGEQWEGVLVSLQNVRVIRINENNGLHQYGLLGSINLVDDLTDLSSIQEGTCLSRVTGVVTYFFDFYLLPRSPADIEVSPQDTACPAIPENRENSNVLCNDGIDNDLDGYTDCSDPSCTYHPDVTNCHETNCTDSIDNDGDNLFDCDDFDCSNAVACGNFFEQNCTDGIDNDSDSFIDCNDVDCAEEPACIETHCIDGNDNDGDGYTDCADFDCLYTESACAQGKEITNTTCSDGVDQDGNGFIDCRDFSCQKSPLVTVCEGNAVSCADGIDNDGNNFIDCLDFACRYCHSTDPSRDRVVSTCPPCVHN